MKLKTTAMLLSALALSVFAAHAGAAELGSDVFANGGTITLTEASTLANAVIDGKEATLDLNGQKLTVTDGSIHVANGAELTIIDSAENQNGRIIFAATAPDKVGTVPAWIIADKNSKINLKSGIISVIPDVSVFPDYYAEASMILANDFSEVNVNGAVIESHGAIPVATILNNGTLNFNDGKILKTSIYNNRAMCIISNLNSTININGGLIDCVQGIVLLNSKLNISGGTIKSELNAIMNNTPQASTITVTGGTFTDAGISNYLSADYTLTEDGTVVPIAPAVTVSTENKSQATGTDGSLATGFVTTISGDCTLDTIEWAVTYAGETQRTEKYNISNITLGGDATIGLIVNGFADANASAKATVNGQISE